MRSGGSALFPVVRRVLLVVDDDPGLAELMVELLAMLGHEPHEAGDGASAVALVLALQPAVVFLDIGLPDMDGYEVARRIRAGPSHAQPLVVAVSGWGNADDVDRALAAGCDYHFVKPIDLATLESLVGRVPA